MTTQNLAKNLLLKDLTGLNDLLARLFVRGRNLGSGQNNNSSELKSQLRQSHLQLEKPFQVSHYDLVIPQLPQAFEGYTILQLTDMHFGPTTPLQHVLQSFEISNSLSADLMVLTGDFIQLSRFDIRLAMAKNFGPEIVAWGDYRRKVRKQADILGAEIAKLQATDGIIATLGNHDYSEGANTLQRRFPKDLNWLINKNTLIERDGKKLLIAGLDDTRYGKPNISGMLEGTEELPEDTIKILLSHNPDHTLLEEAPLLDDFHLSLCGHTHGGQLCLPGGRPIVTRTHQKNHFKGASVFRDTPVYVSNGVGYGGLRLRLYCPPEIAVFTLTAQ